MIHDERDLPFAMIEWYAIDNLSATALLLYVHLVKYAGREKRAFFSVRAMAKKYGKGKAAIMNARKELIDGGYIKPVEKNDLGCSYFAILGAENAKKLAVIKNKTGSTQNHPGSTQNHPGSTQNHPGSTQNHPGSTQNTKYNKKYNKKYNNNYIDHKKRNEFTALFWNRQAMKTGNSEMIFQHCIDIDWNVYRISEVLRAIKNLHNDKWSIQNKKIHVGRLSSKFLPRVVQMFGKKKKPTKAKTKNGIYDYDRYKKYIGTASA